MKYLLYRPLYGILLPTTLIASGIRGVKNVNAKKLVVGGKL